MKSFFSISGRTGKQTKAFFILCTIAIYTVIFLLIYKILGRGIGALAIIPVIAIGWSLGLWGGIAAGILSFPFNLVLLNLLNDEGIQSFVARAGGVAGTMALVLIGGVVGRMAELSRQVRQELAERNTTEAQLRETKDFLENVIESSLDSIVVTDQSGHITRINRAFQAMLGYAQHEIIGKQIQELFIPTRGSYESTTGRTLRIDDAFFTGATLIIDKLLREGTISSWETFYINKKGKIIPVEQNAVILYDKSARRIGSVGIIRDITERKKAEEALRETSQTLLALIDASPLAIFVLNTDGFVTIWNPAAERMFGWRAREVFGEALPFVEEEGRDEFVRLLQTVFAGEGLMDVEMPRKRKDGTVIDISLSAAPLRDEKGAVTAIMTIMSDITEHKRLQKEILSVSDREQHRIGQDLHDGLGQVLTGVAFMSRALERKLAAGSLPEASEAASISKLVNDAIGQTRSLARGLYPVTLETGGLMEALEELALTTEQLLAVPCTLHHSGPVPAPDAATAIHLYRIVQEAVNNALRHGSAHHIMISLDVEEDKTILTVHDDGVGLQEHSRQGKGMGINLMHYRAKMIGATLEVKGAPGRGTTVTCIFDNNIHAQSTGEGTHG